MTFSEIFGTLKSIAVFGMSKNPDKPANYVPVFMQGQEYKIYPINPTAEIIAGEKVSPNIMDVDGEIDILNVFRPSQEAVAVVEEAIRRKEAKGDVKLIWLQEGIISEEAKKMAEDKGIVFIQDKCMYKEFKRLY